AIVEVVENDRPVGKYLIDRTGRDILNGKRYNLILNSVGGLAKVGDKRGEMKYIDRYGRERFKKQ
ncbi:MAG: hypothetical protein NTW50_05375, partial [Candidatus Berkelbacteria bacterium]|nr:hypothetical protein [Candidatus Berkelbacteria bacterium]